MRTQRRRARSDNVIIIEAPRPLYGVLRYKVESKSAPLGPNYDLACSTASCAGVLPSIIQHFVAKGHTHF